MSDPERQVLQALEFGALGSFRFEQTTCDPQRVRPPAVREAGFDHLQELSGKHADDVVVTSTKSMTGHLLGGAGALESIATVLAIHHRVSPPTINLDNPDVETVLDLVPHKAKPMKIDTVLSNSFGFGGTNAAVVFKKVP